MASNEYFYGGKTYSNDPKYNLMTETNPTGIFSGYNSSFADLGTSLDARTANQIKEISKQLNSGIRNVEIAGMSPEVFESMPQDHLKEINRLTKITGTEATVHAPMIDPSGITQEGWNQMVQNSAEKQLWSAIERSHDLNPHGNVVVTMHASTAQLPAAELKVKEGGEEKIKSMILIDPMGKLHPIKEEEKYFPIGIKGEEVGKPIPTSPKFEDEIRKQNEDIWSQQLSQLNFYSQRGVSELSEMGKIKMDKINFKDIKKEEHPEWKNMERLKTHAALDLSEAYRQLKGMYELAYKSAKNMGDNKTINELDSYAKKIIPLAENFENIRQNKENIGKFSDLIEEGVNILGEKKPEILRPLKDFAIEKSAETASNLAFNAYKKFGSSSPIISLENHPAQQSLLTTGGDLRDVVEKARNMFVKKAVKEKGLSEDEARSQAEKLIGATWDVGHINMLRRYGYGKEDIIKETEKVAPFVKHVHLSDNFGFEHTELPMGMGNVPLKEIMGKLNQEGFKGKKVVEALSWWQHFSEQGANHAIIPTMQGMGVPMYSGGIGGNQIYGTPGGYFTGYGTMLPEQHFSLYGAGFTNLPMELGGQISGKDSRFSGTPMS